MIKTVMHPLPYTVGTHQTLAVAKNMMKEHGVKHLPVLDSENNNENLLGVISERDIHYTLTFQGAFSGKTSAEKILVKDSYTPEPYSFETETLVSEVVTVMAHQNIECAVILENNQPIGIFTFVDACHLLSEILSGDMQP